MPHPAQGPIYEAISAIRLIDPHTHINPHSPASDTLADLLGYHYYTELAHSAGMPKAEIEEDGLHPRELVRRLVHNLGPIDNTAQYRWLIEICRKFFDFDGDRLDDSNWESVYDTAERQMGLAEWPQMVLDQSNVEAVFLTNDFDDNLAGFDTNTYIPCLRTDDLVFHLAKTQTRQRLEACTGMELDGSLLTLRESLKQRFEHFVASGARACAISLPPTFEPTPIRDGRAVNALNEVLKNGALADEAHQSALARRVFWTLAELCEEYGLPFDLMIGVNRGVYAGGVYQGQDLYDSRVSLIQYRELFNSFPNVKFPVSVLASVTNQELVSYSWIFPNVITSGHWWYSNTPSMIARDAAARLEAVPKTKQIAYYSDAYKLEFVQPKFDMYRQVLSGILADHFVGQCGWSEERAIDLGRQVLRDNVEAIFPPPARAESGSVDPQAETWREETPTIVDDPMATWIDPQAAGTSAALAAGAIGTVEVNDANDPVEASSEESTDQRDEPTEFSTIVDGEYFDGIAAAPKSEPDEVLAQLDAEPTLPDSPTVAEQSDTVRFDEEDASDDLELSNVEFTEVDLSDSDPDIAPIPAEDDSVSQLDPVPSADEIQAVDVRDVELSENDSQSTIPDVEAINAEADPEPLDVGDIFGNDDASEASTDVRMLRSETSFTPDEDSFRLEPNPATGEYTYPVSGIGDVEESQSPVAETGSEEINYQTLEFGDDATAGSHDADATAAAMDDTVDSLDPIQDSGLTDPAQRPDPIESPDTETGEDDQR